MKRSLKIVLFIIITCVVFALAYFIGYKTAYDRIENAESSVNPQTFYAEIKENSDGNMLVEGLDVNDINFRGEFTFAVLPETELTWRYTPVSLSDLDPGDNISVTFTGEIMESYPAQIADVVKIQLLDDEL